MINYFIWKIYQSFLSEEKYRNLYFIQDTENQFDKSSDKKTTTKAKSCRKEEDNQ